ARVTATLGTARAATVAAASGRFTLRLPPMPAGGPHELTVTCESTGESVTLRNVMVGEVWLASGQSNMEYCLGSDWAAHESVEAQQNALSRQQEKEFKAALDGKGMIRAFSVPRVATGALEESAAAAWQVVSPETAAGHTAVGLWFAKAIYEKTGVAVGILNSSYGGTIAEAWTSRAGLLRNPVTAPLVADMDAQYLDPEIWAAAAAPESDETRFSRITERDRGNAGEGMGWAGPEFADMGWTRMRIPGDWIKQEIAVNGAVWARREVELPASWAGKDVFLRLGGVDKQDTTYFNGVVVGRTGKDFETEHWNIPRAYRVPGALVKAGRNVIAVRAYSFAFDGGFNGVEALYRLELVETGEKIPISGIWRAAPEYEIGRVSGAAITAWGPGNPNSPSILFDAMLRPLLPYALRGAIWYQGESNANSAAESLTYRRKLRTMIEDWRYHFAQGDFPFIQVELANFRDPAAFDCHSAWAALRAAQYQVCRDLPEVYAVSALGLGDAGDIHPQDKKSVGGRLAACALREVYHDPAVVPAGPLFRDFAVEGDAVRVRFDNAAGLRFAGGAPKGFFLANAGRNFRPADQAAIEGDSVVLRCSGMNAPLAVRYSWSDNPDGNLENAAGLPAGTFRTDCWEL
ncbi:MAG: hypothetical protein J6333_10410, partial [Planctomycetes bacterium]|nr:hypothetical protein [Planctomycetota bacterium]